MELFYTKKETDSFFEEETTEDCAMTEEASTESHFNCKNCKSKKIIIDQKQARSADEGMDVILVCMECGHRQRIRG
jgi:DNA-directed RNA polymerase subunit M/transcription elongation factor TFIIS